MAIRSPWPWRLLHCSTNRRANWQRSASMLSNSTSPAFNVYMDEVREWGIAALHAAVKGLACKTAVHICYGYGIKANIDWKASLGAEWRQYERSSRLSQRAGSIRCQSNAPAPRYRSSCL